MDQDVGLSVVMCNSVHPSSIYMGVEAGDWELSDDINGCIGGYNFSSRNEYVTKYLVHNTKPPDSLDSFMRMLHP